MADLSDEQVAELQTEIVSQFETVEGEEPTPESVDVMTSLADALDTVRGELSRREAQAEELAARAAEATARVKGQEDVAEDGEAMADYTEEEEVPVVDETMEEVPTTEEAPVMETEDMPTEEVEMPEEEVHRPKKQLLL